MGFLMRLRAKITLGTLVILLICMAITGTSFIVHEHQRIIKGKQMEGESLASLVAHFSAIPIERYSYFLLLEIAHTVEQSSNVAFCEIYDANGRSLVQTETTIHGIQLSKKERRTDESILIVEATIQNDISVLGKVEIGLDMAPLKRDFQNHIWDLVIAVTIILILAAICINAFLSHNFISPVVYLSGIVKNIAKGDFVETSVATRKDEIGDLARAFNEMSKDLEQLYHGLEQKVEERTRDLATVNHKLQEEISVRLQAEQQLKRAKEAAEQANQYKSNFVANISHEIRTPLNAILGYAQILQDRQSLDPSDKKSLRAIDRSGSHLLGLINDILDLSKIEAGKMELNSTAFDLSLLIRHMASMFRLRCAEKSLAWQVIGIDTEQIFPVIGDPGKLRQVLINLLGNAVKFTDKGSVILRVIVHDNNLLRFSIEDTGNGIPDSWKEKIFKPFKDIHSLSNKEGTGLGLSISKNFMEIMGSSIEVLDNNPTGSRFCFNLTLPRAKDFSQTGEERALRITGLATNNPLLALIVDDDQLSRTMLSHLLNKTDVRTLEAVNGLEAIKLLKTNQPDIIFLDRYMPEMDGLETIKIIHRTYGKKTFPIVMITAAVFDAEQESLEDWGIAALLTKPCEIRKLLECMATTLDLKLQFEQPEAKALQVLKNHKSFSPDEIILPKELHSHLLGASEFGKISELKLLMAQLEATEGIPRSFLNTIKNFLETYQLTELTDLLKSIKTTETG